MRDHFLIPVFMLLVLTAPVGGFAAEEVLTLGDGVSIRVLWFEPETSITPPPLAVFMSGGSNDEFMARAQYWLGRELVARGWAIAVPIADQGRKFFVENSSLVPTVVSQLRERHSVAPGKPLLVGISSGGSAALAVAAKAPNQYAGVIATPGRIWDETRFSDLEGLPIYLRIGEKDDFRWHRKLDSHVEILESAGAKVDAALVPNATHIFAVDWIELENWLGTLEQPD